MQIREMKSELEALRRQMEEDRMEVELLLRAAADYTSAADRFVQQGGATRPPRTAPTLAAWPALR